MRVINIKIDEQTRERVYTRNEVANECGVSTQTIKLWEEAGVIPEATRDDNGYRYWREADLTKVKEYAKIPRKNRYRDVKKR